MHTNNVGAPPMIRICTLTDAARKSGTELRVRELPVDLDPDGDWELLAGLRHTFTNYEALMVAWPDCPQDCPIAALNKDEVGVECGNYQVAVDMLRTRARWVALGALDARRREAGAGYA